MVTEQARIGFCEHRNEERGKQLKGEVLER